MILAVLAALAAAAVILLAVLLVRQRRDELLDERIAERLEKLQLGQTRNHTEVIREIAQTQAQSRGEIGEAMMKGFGMIQESTSERLNEIRHGINEKLDKSLNERLDSSFRQVGDRLEALYRSLGELKNLESGVSSLNRTLSNVKTRGIFGELQLGNLLANLLDRSQYDENVATRPGSDERVEFAIRIPDKENASSFIWLPVDSKFPADIYNKIVTAAEAGSPEQLRAGTRELRERIRSEAATIRDKYVAPPDTTDFAIMFLPTEGIYSEVLRIDGLVEECQQKYKVVIAGPTTLTAIVNSLSVGFKYLTVNRKSEEILKTLGAFKTQFSKFDELIGQTQKKLDEAQRKTADLAHRSDLIKSRLGKVESLSYEDAESLIGGVSGAVYEETGE